MTHSKIAGALLALLAATACGGVTVAPGGGTGGGPVAGDCPAGQADCDGDGRCDPLDTLDHCGACGVACSADNGAAECRSGQCVLSCDAGFADCNGRPDDGCEAELATDPHHCGGCGHDCGADTDCMTSSCVSVLASAPAALVGADSLVAFGADLYWGTPGVEGVGEVASIPLAGGLVTPWATQLGWPERLRVVADGIVWSDILGRSIVHMHVPSGTRETVWQPSGPESPHLLDVSGSQVFFTTGDDVRVIDLSGGGLPLTLAAGLSEVSTGRVRGGDLFIATLGPEIDLTDHGIVVPGHPEGRILRMALSGGPVSVVADHLDTPTALAVTDAAIYWAETGSLATYLEGDAQVKAGSFGRVARAALDGSQRAVLVDGLPQPVDLAVDAQHVYVAVAGTVGGLDPSSIAYEPDGSLLRVPLAGGATETVMPSIDARNVMLTDTAAFFSSWNLGLVLRKQKP